jgi:pyrroloquinoline quinone (PQQ) biosynthesis protein C
VLLAKYYQSHATEELHHDEWMLQDMLAYGMNRAKILARLPSPTTASLIGAQYYWMSCAHPVALMGYLAVLEGYPPSAEHLRELQAEHHLPQGTFRTLLKHAQLDTRHRADLNNRLDQLPLSCKLKSLVVMSALCTMDGVGRVIEDILNSRCFEPSQGRTEKK